MPNEVADLIDSRRAIPVGHDAHKVHWLFFSIFDCDWFVAVRDEHNGEVITVLPINYHSAWRVSKQTLDNARFLSYTGPTTIHQDKVTEILAETYEPASFQAPIPYVERRVFAVQVLYENRTGKPWSAWRGIGKIQIPLAYLQDRNYIQTIRFWFLPLVRMRAVARLYENEKIVRYLLTHGDLRVCFTEE